VLAIQFNQLTRLGATHLKDSRAAREVVDLTGEVTWAMNCDKGFNSTRRAHNFDLAGYYYKEWDISITLLDDHLAKLHCAHMPMR
jgi:chitinase